MIINGILYTIYYFVLGITAPFRLLPDVSLPEGVSAALTSAGSYLSILDAVIPVDTLLSVLGAFLVVETAIFTYKLIKWVYVKVPGVN